MDDMRDKFYRTENFNQEVMSKFADYLDANDLYVMKSRQHSNVHFVVPEDPQKREELLEKILEALNDGFYSNNSCIEYLYELVKRYQDVEVIDDKSFIKVLDFFQ